jgi:hypothetical protein
MDISITIDKSTFQMLSYPELLRLSSYYKHNIAPVLVMEIMGDLKKEVTDGKTPSEERVKDFAKKLFPVHTSVNSYYRNLVKGELMGRGVTFDGRPHVDVEKIVQAEDGSKGFVIQETQEEKSIYKWKAGNFSEADKELSELWRTITTQENLLKNLQKILQSNKNGEKIRNTKELNDKVEAILNDYDKQDSLLVFLIDNYGENEIDGGAIFERYLIEGRPLLKDFAPYAAHCIKVDLLFHYGLMHEVIGTRPTNRVDLEYLYYLPFCNIFTSNDKLHKLLAPLLIREDQKFIIGQELKNDFKNIVEHLESGGDELMKKHAHEPPIIESSLTFQLWKEYFGYPQKSNLNRKMTDQDMEYMKKQMDKFIRASKGEKVEFEEGEEEQFIVKTSWLSKDDPCYCGSGKIIIECCMTNDQFNKQSENPNKPQL